MLLDKDADVVKTLEVVGSHALGDAESVGAGAGEADGGHVGRARGEEGAPASADPCAVGVGERAI